MTDVGNGASVVVEGGVMEDFMCASCGGYPHNTTDHDYVAIVDTEL